MSEVINEPVEKATAAEHIELAHRALMSTEEVIERMLGGGEDGEEPKERVSSQDAQAVLLALSVAQCHASIANAQLMMDLMVILRNSLVRGFRA